MDSFSDMLLDDNFATSGDSKVSLSMSDLEKCLFSCLFVWYCGLMLLPTVVLVDLDRTLNLQLMCLVVQLDLYDKSGTPAAVWGCSVCLLCFTLHWTHPSPAVISLESSS